MSSKGIAKAESATARTVRAVLLACILLGAAACGDFERGKPLPSEQPSTATQPKVGGFESGVHESLLAGCQSCHSTTGTAAATDFILTGSASNDYQASLIFVDKSSPTRSRLVSKAAGLGHGGGEIFAPGTPDYEQLINWISSGAKP